MQSQFLREAISIQSRLKMPREELQTTLTLLRLGLKVGHQVWATTNADERKPSDVAGALIDNVIQLAAQLDKGRSAAPQRNRSYSNILIEFAATSFPAFSCRLAAKHTTAPLDQDGMCMTFSIINLLPCVSFIKLADLRIDPHLCNGRRSLMMRSDSSSLESTMSIIGSYAGRDFSRLESRSSQLTVQYVTPSLSIL